MKPTSDSQFPIRMKAYRIPILVLALASGPFVHAQRQPEPPPQPPVHVPTPTDSPLTKFDLDFPGGTPGQLVAAIQKAMGRSLNAIIPSEFADQKLPPLKMNGVNVAQLFQALENASRGQRVIRMGRSTRYDNTAFGFFHQDEPVSDNTIWYFQVQSPPVLPPPNVSRFYLLTPYLDHGLTVDDITTAVQTAWKMRGEPSDHQPAMSFHPETKLLIAVGDEEQVQVIDQVLNALHGALPSAPATATRVPGSPPNPGMEP